MLAVSGCAVVAFALSIVVLLGLNEKWGWNIFSHGSASVSREILGLPATLSVSQKIQEAPHRIAGVVENLNQGRQTITVDPSFGLEENRLATISFDSNTRFWRAAVKNLGSPPLVYYRQAMPKEEIKLGDIVGVWVWGWNSFSPPDFRAEAESVGVFDKLLPEIKEILRSRYGDRAAAIESY